MLETKFEFILKGYVPYHVRSLICVLKDPLSKVDRFCFFENPSNSTLIGAVWFLEKINLIRNIAEEIEKNFKDEGEKFYYVKQHKIDPIIKSSYDGDWCDIKSSLFQESVTNEILKKIADELEISKNLSEGPETFLKKKALVVKTKASNKIWEVKSCQ